MTQSRSWAWTSSSWFMSRKSMQTPPAGALTCPSSEVPVPNAITGTPFLAQIRTTSWISAVSCAITTASGGWFCSQVVVCPCCSRTACEVTRRLPKRAAKASSALASALGSGRFKFSVMVIFKLSSRPDDDRGKGQKRGQEHHDRHDHHRRPFAPPRPVSVLGDAGRAAMDRLQRPSQHGLLQRDVRSRHRRAMVSARDRAGLYARASWLALYRRMPRPLLEGNPPGRSRADCDHPGRLRREAAPYVRG